MAKWLRILTEIQANGRSRCIATSRPAARNPSPPFHHQQIRTSVNGVMGEPPQVVLPFEGDCLQTQVGDRSGRVVSSRLPVIAHRIDDHRRAIRRMRFTGAFGRCGRRVDHQSRAAPAPSAASRTINTNQGRRPSGRLGGPPAPQPRRRLALPRSLSRPRRAPQTADFNDHQRSRGTDCCTPFAPWPFPLGPVPDVIRPGRGRGHSQRLRCAGPLRACGRYS